MPIMYTQPETFIKQVENKYFFSTFLLTLWVKESYLNIK